MSITPAQFPPPVAPDEFVATDLRPAEQQIPVGVLFVGAGPASLAGAIRLAQLLETAPDVKAALGDVPIAVIEKGKYPGAHLLSGAVINPSAFRKLFPDLTPDQWPFAQAVPGESVYFLTPSKALPMPVPPTMRNHGNFVASLAQVGKWLAAQAEARGVMLLNETAGAKILMQQGTVRGVRAGDKGRDRHGEPLPNFEPGADLLARYTVFGEGTQGHLTAAALEHFRVRRAQPQIYALGVKEVWEVRQPLTRVIHTMGWPLRAAAKYREFGGSFAYPLGDKKISLGLVVGLDYADASLSVHDLLQELKTHPLFRAMLAGGRRADQGWGAKTIPEGGLYSLPERLHVPGACVIGDSAGFVNVPALKGVHYAMWSGILAAEALFEALKTGRADAPILLPAYDGAVRHSFIWKDLHAVRNMRQAFHGGFWKGALLSGLMTITGGRFPGGALQARADSEQELLDTGRVHPKADRQLTFDKLDSVHAAGNRSSDNQPNHVRVRQDVDPLVGKMLVNMCPAAVYEWDEANKKVIINPTNCIHCGAISAKGGRLTPPEGGSGPEYTEM